MAEAPSLSTSTRATAAIGMVFRSTAPPLMPCVDTRRPFSSTSVPVGPRPRRLANEEPPVRRSCSAPKTLLREVALSTLAELALSVPSNSSAVVTPSWRIWSALMTCSGSAPSSASRLMLEPVISTRCVVCAETEVTRPARARP